MQTDDGHNLLEPGHTPSENAQFILLLAGLIKAVDTHADLLRGSTANSGNDHRLGANEAPPAIISVFLGDELTTIIETIAAGGAAKSTKFGAIDVGVKTLPAFPRDNTDRNRTSPFAFTGNKFEFRMVGSSSSIAGPCIILNTMVAEVLDEFATRLEKTKNFNAEVTKIVTEVMKEHGRIIFNGDGYSDGWVVEAEKRGLPNIKNCVEAHKAFTTKKAIALFKKYGVLSPKELESRYEIYIEQYASNINIEAETAIKMIKTQYIPSIIEYTAMLADTVNSIKDAGSSAAVQAKLLNKVSELLETASDDLNKLEVETDKAYGTGDTVKRANAYQAKVFPLLTKVRESIDALEEIVSADYWPVPTYSEMMFKL
jgi:glutamine synthetase